MRSFEGLWVFFFRRFHHTKFTGLYFRDFLGQDQWRKLLCGVKLIWSYKSINKEEFSKEGATKIHIKKLSFHIYLIAAIFQICNKKLSQIKKGFSINYDRFNIQFTFLFRSAFLYFSYKALKLSIILLSSNLLYFFVSISIHAKKKLLKQKIK